MDNIYSLNVSNDSEKDRKYEKTVHKRRSSVFQHRSNTLDQRGENEEVVDIGNVEKCASNESQEEPFNLEKYIISLRNERKEWIETLKQRKVQRRHLAKQKLRLEKEGEYLDLSVLTKRDKAFITARPNYQYICKNYKKLSDTAGKISVLHNLVYRLNQRFILQMEEKVNRITDKIIAISKS
ncbi:uncharacterized protein LOC143425981 [Xylocopa sonorina]|uniref:uncharacterized protein LOC143425981 n=1 Tax=Xylocopa sonorina TaxID=1818115 RepID=UPI00403A9077